MKLQLLLISFLCLLSKIPFHRKQKRMGVPSGVHNMDPINPILTKLGGQVEKSHPEKSQPEIPCEFGISSTLDGAFCYTMKLTNQFVWLQKLCAQLCQSPCYCPWLPPRCPPGSPLVLDGCGCCTICARRLGEPCSYLHVCDQSQGLVCDYSTAPAGRGGGGGGTCNYEEADDSCEVNGKVYRDGEAFQPTCKHQCYCSEGGVTCVPLCSEDVRLPTSDCPHPRRVEVPGKCCPEWICERQDRQVFQDAMAAQRLPGTASRAFPFPCEEWSTAWSACSTTCNVGISTRVSNKNVYCRLETQRRLCFLRPCLGLARTASLRGRGNQL